MLLETNPLRSPLRSPSRERILWPGTPSFLGQNRGSFKFFFRRLVFTSSFLAASFALAFPIPSCFSFSFPSFSSYLLTFPNLSFLSLLQSYPFSPLLPIPLSFFYSTYPSFLSLFHPLYFFYFTYPSFLSSPFSFLLLPLYVYPPFISRPYSHA